jgi:GTP-binding protein YchF
MPYQIGIMQIPDERLSWLHEMAQVPKKILISFEIVDFAAIREGIFKESEYIAQLRLMDAFINVINLFELSSDDIVSKANGMIHDIDLQFIISDLELTQNRIERITAKIKKTKDKQLMEELPIIEKCNKLLLEEKPLRDLTLSEEEEKFIKGFGFLSLKPILHILNVSDAVIGESNIMEKLSLTFENPKVRAIVSCIRLEKELLELNEADAKVFAKEWNITEYGIDKLSKIVLSWMGLISFFTIGREEVKAWCIAKGTNAQKAAGTIHSDMEKGFIKAEVISFDELKKIGNINQARKIGALRFEGKDYIVKDGDVINFKFNV